MLRVLKALPLALAIVALIVFAAFAASCNSSNTQARFINAIPGENQALDIDVNGVKVFTDVLFGNFQPASGYAGIPAGNDPFQLLATGTTTPAYPSTVPVTLNSGKQYTLVATGSLSGTVTILNPVDNNTEPADGFVSFRVINASPSGPNGGGGAVDVYILPNPNQGYTSCSGAGVNCISGLAYQSTSGYVNLPFNSAGNGWQIIVTPTGNTTPYFNDTFPGVGNSTLGAICTLVLTDVSAGGTMSTSYLQLNDLNCAP